VGKLLVFSADAMVYEDLEYLRTLPNYRKYLAGGAEIKAVRSVYPTVTYPVHVSLVTGTYPDRHGVTSNHLFRPGENQLPWYWYRSQVKGTDLFDVAKQKGLSTGSVFWPLTGNHPSIDYLVSSYWSQGTGDTVHDAFARTGANSAVLEIIDRHTGIMKEWEYPSWDIFRINCACDIIRQFNPDLMLVHPFNIDHYRHHKGVFNEDVIKGIEETDVWIGQIMDAYKAAGTRPEEVSFFLISDHGQIDIKRIININVLLADYGLIRADKEGDLPDWDAWCMSNGASAEVFLRDKDNHRVYEKTYTLLRQLCKEGLCGISRVFTEPEIRNLEHLGGDFSFVLETDGYTAFGGDWTRPIVKNFDSSDYRYGHATHGYLPDKGPQPMLVAKGPGIRNGVVLEKCNIVDEAPTFARILGVSMPEADGRCIDEILQ
jgi:predicted AlkP superfamily pyrophosphatase or phosphodiesterase